MAVQCNVRAGSKQEGGEGARSKRMSFGSHPRNTHATSVFVNLVNFIFEIRNFGQGSCVRSKVIVTFASHIKPLKTGMR